MKLELTQPLVFEPLFMERVWGGRRLESVFGKKLPAGKRIGESWEIVDRPEAQSIVRRGPLRGRALHELWLDYRREIFGDEIADAPRFPLLLKLLDAEEALSLQVHPSADVATALGGEAKAEMWYFAKAAAGAELHAGWRRGTQKSQLQKAIREGRAADLVHRFEVRTGDAFFVPAGRLHAIGAGNLIVEIQQNSDTTYRVFDWNRTDADGKARALHLDQAMQAINFHDFEPGVLAPVGEQLVQCSHFRVEKWNLTAARKASKRRACALFVCLSGRAELAGAQFMAGEFFLIPVALAQAELKPVAPETSLLRITLPTR